MAGKVDGNCGKMNNVLGFTILLLKYTYNEATIDELIQQCLPITNKKNVNYRVHLSTHN